MKIVGRFCALPRSSCCTARTETLGSAELTFILLAPPEGASPDQIPSTQELTTRKMIGDVNLFLPNGVEEDVECEIMIAGAFPRPCDPCA